MLEPKECCTDQAFEVVVDGVNFFALANIILRAVVKQEKWKPLYTLVTFSHTPYNEAWDRGEMQQAVMNEVMTIENIEGVWEEDSTIDFAIETLERYLS